jgi:hypothetical protein
LGRRLGFFHPKACYTLGVSGCRSINCLIALPSSAFFFLFEPILVVPSLHACFPPPNPSDSDYISQHQPHFQWPQDDAAEGHPRTHWAGWSEGKDMPSLSLSPRCEPALSTNVAVARGQLGFVLAIARSARSFMARGGGSVVPIGRANGEAAAYRGSGRGREDEWTDQEGENRARAENEEAETRA